MNRVVTKLLFDRNVELLTTSDFRPPNSSFQLRISYFVLFLQKSSFSPKRSIFHFRTMLVLIPLTFVLTI